MTGIDSLLSLRVKIPGGIAEPGNLGERVEQLSQIPQLVVSVVTSGCIYAIVAIGFSIIYNSTQIINFAQGEFVMV